MENYTKGKNVEEELERHKLPYHDLPEDFLWMKVKAGSKMPNLITHAIGLLEDKAVNVMVWSGVGVAISKTISCAEIVKRQSDIKNQVTRLSYITVEEYWEPKLEGLETLVVKRQIPVIHIMLSVNEIADKNQLGFQTKEGRKFWQDPNASASSSNQKAHQTTNQAHKPKKYYKYKKPTKQ